MELPFCNSIQFKQMSYVNFASFEYAALPLNSSRRAVFLNIYRPLKYSANSFDDFAELPIICIDFGCEVTVLLVPGTAALKNCFVFWVSMD